MKNPKRSLCPDLPLAILDQIDLICDRFERAGQSETRPVIEDYLGEMAIEYRSALLRDLVAAEVHARRQRGVRPERREYTVRFPADSGAIAAAFDMIHVPSPRDTSPVAESNLLFGLIALQNGLIDQDQLVNAFRAWSRDKARPLADHLVDRGDLDDADRGAVLALAARHLKKHGGDTEKSLAAIAAGRSTVDSLAGLGDPEIEYAMARVAAVPTEPDRDQDRTASYAFGSATSDGQRFRVLRPHAKGGLGAVFVAHDAELHREVALKQILEQHADDPNSRQRFLLEAEITGGLEHPGIVPVYALGAYGDGRPYYAMRFIRGDSLKEAIERFHGDETFKENSGERRLEIRKLIRRFTDVCNAIEYAHSRGVLHRDIKPGNIIVGKHGETLVVDWGLAKARGRAAVCGTSDERPLVPTSASGSVETLPGSALGTPAYMSPEQALGDLESLGPSSDVYSLGATLYCLLTGKPPVENNDPGQALRAAQNGEFLAPRQLNPTIDRALEAICQKSMALRRQERYMTPRALADDIERWMADEPVSAYVEPWIGRARRWARRHRTTVVTSACLLVASVIGLTAGLVLLQAKQRETEAARREAVTNFQTAVQARRDADAARQDAEANFERAMNAVETMLVRVSQKHLANLPQFEPVRRQLLEDALGFYGDFLRRAGDSPAVVQQAAHAYKTAGDIHGSLGQRDLARQELSKSLELIERIAAGPVRDLQQAGAHHSRAAVDMADRFLPQSIEQYQRALAILTALRNSSLEPRERRAVLDQEAQSASGLSTAFSLGFRLAEAHDAIRRARQALEQLAAGSPTDESYRYRLSAVEHNEGFLLLRQHDLSHAVEHWRTAIRLQEELLDSSPNMVHYRRDQANSLSHLGLVLGRIGRISEATKAERRAIALFGQLTADYPTVPEYRFQLAAAHHHLGYILISNQEPALAEKEFRQSIESLEMLRRREPQNLSYTRDLANSYMHLGRTFASLRRLEDSVSVISRAYTIFAEEARLHPDNTEYLIQAAAAEDSRSSSLKLEGRLGEAVLGYRHSQQILGELLAREPSNWSELRDLSNSTISLGQCLLATGERSQAGAELTKALEILNGLITQSPHNVDFLDGRCRALVLLGRYDVSLKAAETLASLTEGGEKNLYRAACVLAFNLSRPERDPLAAARIPTDRAGTLADRAMGFLAQALVRGQCSPEGITIDEELDALRPRSDFPSLSHIFLDRGFPTDPFAR